MMGPLTKVIAAAGLCAFATGTANAADVTLKLAHFFAADSGFDKLFNEWAAELETASSNRIDVQVFPAETLARANKMIDAVQSGITDVGVTVQGYTVGRFPLTQLVELPGVVGSGKQGACTLWKMYESGLTASEYQDIKPVFFWTTGPGHIHLRGKPAEKPSDLAGLTIRRPSDFVGSLLESFGAQSVGQPAPEMYPNMQRGVIDGVTLAWEGMVSWRISELTGGHTEIALYSLSLTGVMNAEFYDRLPEDLKPIVDSFMSPEWSQRVGVLVDDLDGVGRKMVVDAGIPIHTVEGGVSNPLWKDVVDAQIDKFLDGVEATGVKARENFPAVKELAASCNS